MHDRPMTHARAVALMVVANVLWSTAGLVARLLEQRAELGSHVLAQPLRRGLDGRDPRLDARDERRGRRCGPRAGPGSCRGSMFCTMFTCFMLAVTRTTVANTLVVNSLYPVFAADSGVASCCGQRLPSYTWIAIVAAVGGMVWMFAAGLGEGLSGTLIAFGVPIAAAVNVVTLRKWGRTRRSGPRGPARRSLLGAPDAAVRAPVPARRRTDSRGSRRSECSSSPCPA